ncbi:MAG: glutamate--tRNA ligase, partial [Planctomycetes bacterium]|nr:glutamate--tRNA ligase [Planctomycetota bacterium]
HVEDSVAKILDDLQWLGLTWDEGPEVGGDFGPYLQSQRLDIYERHVQQLLESGRAYYALETTEELQAMRQAAERATGGFRYSRPDLPPTVEQGQAARAKGQPVVVRLKMPDEPITVVDEILGEITVEVDQHEDFVIQKSDGFPTYHFACVVDDALMKVTHVLRGQEHLMNTPKHLALQRALGFPSPRYAHLPVIFNMDGSKMSKRDKDKALKKGLPPPEIDVHDFRVAGYLPEALVNFLSLLGWSVGADREQIDLQETVELFSLDRVGKTNAKFDREKLLSFNTDWAARLAPERLLELFKDYVALNTMPMLHESDETLAQILKACKGFRTFADVQRKAGFIFVPDDAIEYDPKAVKKVLAKNDGAGYAMLEHLLPKLETMTDWSAGPLEQVIQSVCQEQDTTLGNVAQPIRVAVSGTTISPSIHETLVLLGKEQTVWRIRNVLRARP